MTENVEHYRGFAVTVDAMNEAVEAIRLDRRAADKRVCLCGHPISRHSEYAGRVSCTPTRMVCPCAAAIPVIEAADTRPFLRKTRGPGPLHALMTGVQALMAKHRTWDWLPGFPACTKCKTEGVSVVPAAITRTGDVSYEPEATNVLLCEPCLEVVKKSGRSRMESL